MTMTEPTPESSKGKSVLKVLLRIGGWFLFLIGVLQRRGLPWICLRENQKKPLFNGIAVTVGLIFGALGFLAMIKLEVNKGLLLKTIAWQNSDLRNAPGRIRTCDPRLRRPLLYPAELRAPVRII